MRRTHLRGHANISKRLLVHVAAFNLGILMRDLHGAATPKEFAKAARVLERALISVLGHQDGAHLATKLVMTVVRRRQLELIVAHCVVSIICGDATTADFEGKSTGCYAVVWGGESTIAHELAHILLDDDDHTRYSGHVLGSALGIGNGELTMKDCEKIWSHPKVKVQ